MVNRLLVIFFLDCNEKHSAKTCMKDLQKPTQCAQKISVYGLPGRCKHLDCLVFQHLESRLAVQDQLARDFLDLNQLFVSKSSPKYQCTYFASNNCCSKHLPSTWRVAWAWDGLGWLNGDSAAHTWRRRPVLTAMAVTPIRDSLAAKQQRWPQQEEEEGGEARVGWQWQVAS